MSCDFSILATLVRIIREQALFRPNDTLVVALSGGADSTALLDLLANLPGYSLSLVAAHLNHCLRGAESDLDEEFCRRLTASRAIPLEVRRVDVKALAQSRGWNLEDAGRRARIDFLDQVREKYSASAVVTAHHSDDQAETVLMRLLRGSGLSGLSGMAYRNRRGYVRPLLDISRQQIEEYLNLQGIDWREDASNRDTSYLRNRIRHQLLPLLEQYNPSIRHTLNASAAILSAENDLLEKLAEQAFEGSWLVTGESVSVYIAHLTAQPQALQRRVLRLAYRRLTGNLHGLGLEHVQAMLQLLASSQPNSRVALPQGICALREYQRFLLCPDPEKLPRPTETVTVAAPGQYPLPDGGTLTVELCHKRPDFKQLPANSACFDLDRTRFPWQVRAYLPGDRMTPFGMQGRKKVKDIFIDRKIPLLRRRRIPLLFCGQELVWIAGVSLSETVRIGDRSGEMVLVTWHDSE